MWNEFDALSRVPVLVIRGAKSDILSAEAVAEMRVRHPTMEVIEVANQDHVPLLDEADLIRSIAESIGRCDGVRHRTGLEQADSGFIESRAMAEMQSARRQP
jgi:hypothetical protein